MTAADLLIAPCADGTWAVTSRPGAPDEARYRVDPNRRTCTCPSGAHRRSARCKHLAAVDRALELRAA